MASMNELEMEKMLQLHSNLEGAELTSLCYNEKALQLRFEKPERYWWVNLSLKPGSPYFFIASSRIFLVRSLKKPLTIFLRTHFVSEKLLSMRRVSREGRVIEFQFSGEKKLKASLFPGGQNLELEAHGKTLFAYKPKEVKASESSSEENFDVGDLDRFLNLWQKQNKQETFKAKTSPDSKDNKKEIKKKKNGLDKMKEKLESFKNSPWEPLGHWLKENQSLEDLPEIWSGMVDLSENLSWNIENAFAQHKKNQSKIDGTIERMKVLEEEIKNLEEGTVKKVKKPTPSLMTQSQAKGRTFDVNGYKVYMGKSAKDNLTLLRKAKPWYLWLHIRDYPGAYGIIQCEKKGGELPLETLQKASQFVVKQSVGERAEGAYQVLIAECRYVRPIKGAKSGQVTYSHEKVITVKV
ncbi:MAG: hypothetical protein HRT44_03265 [Bdellovibrionales bacterium]|nr:hypothetical protein [Bdellovibrionales bacterium]NQZ18266.1 hypothetical protein [Bdellovibrionales bacterium]